jgi:hypothetical protein
VGEGSLSRPPLVPDCIKKGRNYGKQSSMSIYNLAKNELSSSQISNDDNVAFLRKRIPAVHSAEVLPHHKLWLD